jgi:hypothetical protein
MRGSEKHVGRYTANPRPSRSRDHCHKAAAHDRAVSLRHFHPSVPELKSMKKELVVK